MTGKIKKELKGVKGWLLFFAIIFSFMFPFLTLNRLFIEPLFYYGSFKIFWPFEFIELMVGISSLSTGILIFAKSSKSIISLKIFLAFFLLDSIYIHIIQYNHDIKGLLESILYSIVITTIFYLYFKNSERVRNTLTQFNSV